MTEVHFVLPNDIDDPAAPSGGNAYDRRICDGLTRAGWTVYEHDVHGTWPEPSPAHRAALAGVLAKLPDGATVLLDGLVASAVPDVLVPEADRLRLVVLVHLPLGTGEERAVLHAVDGIVATSSWSRARLLELYRLPPERVHVARPGVDAADLAAGSRAGDRLLCVAAVTPHKGHDLLVEALATVADRPWSCVCAGSLERDPGFVAGLRDRVDAHGLAGRLCFSGPRIGDDLEAAYAGADLLVLASRGETYGMVVTEALARGIPVLATAANGLPEALGRAPDGSVPGLLVRPGHPAALAAALRRWLDDERLRERLRHSARARRGTLAGWPSTVDTVAAVLAGSAP